MTQLIWPIWTGEYFYCEALVHIAAAQCQNYLRALQSGFTPVRSHLTVSATEVSALTKMSLYVSINGLNTGGALF
jgi:hypothetical protein